MSDSRHVKFTQSAVKDLSPPERGRLTYWDSLLPGFGLRMSAPRLRGGYVHKAWVAMYRVCGTQVMETIGSMTLNMKVEDARERARESMRKAVQGINPVQERRVQKEAPIAPIKDPSLLSPAVIDAYLEKYETGRGRNGRPRRPKTIELEKTCLNPLKTWQPYVIVEEVQVNDGENWSLRYFDDLTRDDVERYCEAKGDEGFEVMANRSHAAIKRMFKWAERQKPKIIGFNPIADLSTPYPEAGRERWLSDAEIRAFWWACEELDYPYGPMHQLLLLMPMRLREVAELPIKGELDTDAGVWTLPAARTKPARTFLVPLADFVLAIVNRLPRFAGSDFLFTGAEGAVVSGFSKAKTKLDKLMLDQLKREGHIAADGELERWVVHDLRHTARTNFSKLGIDGNIAERLLNHKLSGIQGRYDHWQYFDEKKDALERWCHLVEKIISTK